MTQDIEVSLMDDIIWAHWNKISWPVPGEFPAQSPVTQSFAVLDLPFE